MPASREVLLVGEFGPLDLISEWAVDLFHEGRAQEALQRCREGELLCALAGDVRTLRYLQYIRAICHLETGDAVSSTQVVQHMLAELPPGAVAWRAKVLALLAESLLERGLPTEAMDALAEAQALAATPAAS